MTRRRCPDCNQFVAAGMAPHRHEDVLAEEAAFLTFVAGETPAYVARRLAVHLDTARNAIQRARYAELGPADVQRICSLRAAGWRVDAIAERYRLRPGQVVGLLAGTLDYPAGAA